ncbi:hypothetical protein [Candidatus Protochlamydia phocaeensis]|uniref:hypothetical protein n=1 Tax=Candidatus Protochlamydia phocaeensis TaxID=1414722 RepID=UPI00083874EA|nr:hypothetical protein [Candidatus Protochlamydia phocaeensis]
MRSFLSSRLFLFFFFILLLLGIFVVCLPTLVSTEWGKKQVVSWINRSIPGNVEIRSLKLHWGKGQVIEGILLKDPEGQAVVGIENFSTEATLWQLLRKSTQLGLTHVEELNAAIVTDGKGISNLQRALGIRVGEDHPRLPPSTILLSDVNATLDLFAKGKPLAAHLTGTTRQENLVGSFDIDVALNGLYANNWDQLSQDAKKYLSLEGSKDAKMHVKVVNFPVDLIDRLVALKRPDLDTLFRSLLGEKLNLIIDKEPSSEGLAFNLTALSPLMQGDVKGKIVQGVFTLSEPALFQFNLKPDSLNPFTHYRFEILEEARLKVLFQDLTLPLAFLDNKTSADPCQFGFKAQTDLSPVRVDIFPIGEIKILNLKTLLESPLCHKTISVQVIGQAQQDREPFDIHFESLLHKPANLHNLVQQLRKGMESSLKVSHLPLRLVPFLASYPGLIKQAGSHADLQLAIKQKNEEDLALTLSFHTPRIVLNQAQFKIGKELSLMEPLALSWNFDTDCLQTLLSSPKFTLEQPCPVLVTVKRLNIPLDEHGQGRIQLESAIKQIQLSQLSPLGIVQAKDIVFKAEGESLSEFQTTLSSQLAFLKADGFYSPLLNRPVQMNVSSLVRHLPDEKLDFPVIKLQMTSQTYDANLEGHLTKDRLFILNQPFKIHYLLTPEALQELNSALGTDLAKLQSPTTINAIVSPTQIDLKQNLIKDLNLNGLINLDHVVLQKKEDISLPSLEQTAISWSINGPENTINLHLKGLASTNTSQKPSHLDAQAHIQRWLSPQNSIDFSQSIAEINTHFVNLPTSFASAVVSNRDLTPLIGPTLDIDLKALIDRNHVTPGYWDMYVDSPNFHAKARIRIDEALTLYESNSPSAEIRWTLSPEGYRYLENWLSSPSSPKLTLEEPITFMANATNLYIPLKNFSKEAPASFAINLSTTSIHWAELPSAFKLIGKLESADLTQDMHVSLQTASSPETFLKLDGTVSHLLSPSGKLQKWQETDLQAHLEAKRLPVQWIQALPATSISLNRLQALIGEEVDIQASTHLQQLSGPLTAEFKGENGQASLDGQLTQGVLTLRKPFEWKIRATPQLTDLVKENMPVLNTLIGAEAPLTLMIDPKGFSCPLVPFEFNRTTIERGMIDLGKIHFRNEGDLRSILNLIHPISDNQLTIWFTPLYFQLNKGVLALQRLDLLVANLYTLASWGEIDLNSHKMNMVLGVTAQTLRYAFHVQGLDDSYILQIPLKGRKGSIEIDKKLAAGRISALIAQMHGDPKAKLLGTVLETAISDHFDATPPAPTTQPFPWAQEFTPPPVESDDQSSSPSDQNSSEDSKSGKKKRKRLQDMDANDLLKGLEQGASSLLEQWIK